MWLPRYRGNGPSTVRSPQSIQSLKSARAGQEATVHYKACSRPLDSSLADFSQGGSLGIRKAHTGGKVSAEDAILSCEVFILEQEFLIDQPGDVRQQPSPFVVWHEEHPS
jgi:hypothetical protein